MSRRDFLLATAGLAVAAACGGDDGDGDDGPVATVSDPASSGPIPPFNLFVSTYLHFSGIDERVTAILVNGEGTGPLPLDGPVELSLEGIPLPAELHGEGVPQPYLLARHRFDQPGNFTIKATYKGDSATAALQVADPRGVKQLYPGQPMISTPSPTAANNLGVDPICTAQPICPLHEVSLDAALAEKRPLAVLFSTPALCQSRFCGPVLDNLVAQREAFGDRVRMLHVEIYTDRSGRKLAPTVEAYNLALEPFLFTAGADGVIRERIDNLFDKKEAKEALQRLLG